MGVVYISLVFEIYKTSIDIFGIYGYICIYKWDKILNVCKVILLADGMIDAFIKVRRLFIKTLNRTRFTPTFTMLKEIFN